MDETRTADTVLDRQFLDMRSRLLDLAADFDRLDRAGRVETPDNRTRLAQLREAVGILAQTQPGRAEHVLMSLSDEYDPDWKRP